MTSTLENFINFCDEMQIVEESNNGNRFATMAKSAGHRIIDIIDLFITKAINLVNKMILNFKKIHKYSVPEPVMRLIKDVKTQCETMWLYLISSNEVDYEFGEYRDYNADIIMKSRSYSDLFLSKETYDDELYVDVPVNEVVNDMKKVNNTLMNTRINLRKRERRDIVLNMDYWTNLQRILTIELDTLNKYFTYGKAQNNKVETIQMPDFEVEIIM